MGKFFKDFGKGIGYFFKSWNVIFGKGLWHYFAYPILIVMVFYVLVFVGVLSFGDFLETYFKDLFTFKASADDGAILKWIKETVTEGSGLLAWIAKWLVKIILGIILGTVMKYIILIILSPVLSLVSEATEERLLGNKYPFNFGQLMKDILRGSLIALRNMMIEFGLFLLGFLLLFIPVLGPLLFMIYGVFLWFVSWYFYGFAMLDYSSERHRLSFRESVKFVWQHKGVAIGIGFVYAGLFWGCEKLFFWVPVFGSRFGDTLGLIFIPIMGAVGASIAFMEIRNVQKKTEIVTTKSAG